MGRWRVLLYMLPGVIQTQTVIIGLYTPSVTSLYLYDMGRWRVLLYMLPGVIQTVTDCDNRSVYHSVTVLSNMGRHESTTIHATRGHTDG